MTNQSTCNPWTSPDGRVIGGCKRVVFWGPNPQKPGKNTKFDDKAFQILHRCPTDNSQPKKDANKTMVTSHANHIVAEIDMLIKANRDQLEEKLQKAFTKLSEEIGSIQEIVVQNMATLTKDVLTIKKHVSEIHAAGLKGKK